MDRYIDNEKLEKIETFLSKGISLQLVPTKSHLIVRRFQDSPININCKIGEKRLNLIEECLAKGYRVEIMPFEGYPRIYRVKRREIKF